MNLSWTVLQQQEEKPFLSPEVLALMLLTSLLASRALWVILWRINGLYLDVSVWKLHSVYKSKSHTPPCNCTSMWMEGWNLIPWPPPFRRLSTCSLLALKQTYFCPLFAPGHATSPSSARPHHAVRDMQAEEVGRELQRIGDDFNRTLLARVGVHVRWLCVFVGALTCVCVLGGICRWLLSARQVQSSGWLA